MCVSRHATQNQTAYMHIHVHVKLIFDSYHSLFLCPAITHLKTRTHAQLLLVNTHTQIIIINLREPSDVRRTRSAQLSLPPLHPRHLHPDENGTCLQP